MKKLLIISLLVVLSLGFAHAQSIYGLRAGLNISEYGGDADMDSKIGFNAGMFMHYKLHPMLLLQPELNYTQRGAQNDFTIAGVKTEVKQTLHYAELPIYLKLDLGERDLKFQPYLGPEMRYLISAKQKIKVGSNEDTADIDNVKDLDFGLGIGIDMMFNHMLIFGARYSLGLSNIDDNGGDVTNNAIMINLGVLY
jgi:hypothetical protein